MGVRDPDNTTCCTLMKGKAIPVQAYYSPVGSRRSGSISRQSVHEGGKVVSPVHWLPGTHFC